MKEGKSNSGKKRISVDPNETYDLCIIGGGITGACVFWDATLRGLKVLLIEKNDYASGTSQATSKMIHGGLRYLKNAEFGLVRESLRERSILGKLTPHSIQPLGYLLPVYNLKNRIVLKIGLTMYDILGFDRNKILGSDNLIPGHSFISKERTISEDPNIPRDGLLGSFLYYDYSNINPERHTSEFIFSAKKRGGRAYNYTELISAEKISNLFQLEIKDKLTGETTKVNSKTLLNSGGPWADFIDGMLKVTDTKHLIRSKGIHIITRKLTGKHTYIVQTNDKKHMFVIPWRNLTIIGTTDTIYGDHPDKFKVNKNDIEELIKEINEYTNFSVSMEDVRSYYGGLRPLVEESGATTLNTYQASRKTEIVNHKENGVEGFFTALGGKYTTSRHLAETAVDMICEFLPGKWKKCETRITPLDSGKFSDVPSLIKDLKNKFSNLSDEKAYNLANRYGFLSFEILETKSGVDVGELNLDFTSSEKYYPEELTYSIENEEVFHLEDLYFRRSGIGNPGQPSPENQKKIREIFKKIKNYSEMELNTQEKEFLKRYEIL